MQRLSDRLLSETISRQMLASGYRMVRPLGEGTYGSVWLAEEENTGIRVAIKFFAHGTGQQWQMLQDEVKQLAALDGASGIVHLKDVVADADPPYYVMSYAEGGSLAQRLAKGPLPLAEALSIFKDVVATLAYVHAHGIRHCDLKPGNILLDQMGRPLVADFGQAHLSNDATPALGTFFYMAPEQADLGRQIPDTRWDVYGLGALFYAMLTGQPPRKDGRLSDELSGTLELDHRLRRYREGIADTPAPTAHRLVRGMDRPLASIIDRCLELEPKKRLPGAQAILHALERRRIRRRQRPLLWYGIAAPLVAAMIMALMGLMMFRHEVNASRSALSHQVMDSDQVLAQLVANGMELGLRRRLSMMDDLLADDSGRNLRRLIADNTTGAGAGGSTPAAVDEKMQAWLERAADDAGIGKMFTGLMVVDANGFIRAELCRDEADHWAVPADHADIWARNWSWRDWFGGRGNRPQGERYAPLTAPHISQPILSKEQGRGVLLDLTVPVKDAHDPAKVVGLLVGSITWKEFTRWQQDVTIEHGKVVIFNQRGQALRHETGGQDDVEGTVREHEDGDPPARAVELDRQLPNRAARDVNDSFHDPFQEDGRERLIGYKFFNPNDEELDAGGPLGTQWGVIVEHRKDKVLAPVGNLLQFMVYKGVWILIAAGLLAVGIRMGLSWLLRREERLSHG